MDTNSILVWWLLGFPLVLAIYDAATMSGGKTSGAGQMRDA